MDQSSDPGERVAVRRAIQEREDLVFKLEGEIQEREAIIERLEREIAGLHERLRVCFIEMVPVELLSRIFVFTCEGETIAFSQGPESHDSHLSTDATAIILTQVSKLWRTVAMNLPALWSRLDVYMVPCSPFNPCDDSACPMAASQSRFIQLFKTFLDRSKDFPLDLTLHNDHNRKYPGCYSNSSERLLAENANRLTKLEMCWVDLEFLEPSVECPVLEQLTLSNFHFPRTKVVTLNAPKLTKVVYSDWLLNGIPSCPNFQLPWTQLTELFFVFRGSGGTEWEPEEYNEQFFYVLRQSTNITTLRISIGLAWGRNPLPWSSASYSQIQLPRLRKLEIQDQPQVFFSQRYLAAFNTPSLQTFDFLIADVGKIASTEIMTSYMVILTFLQRCPRLQTLRLGVCDRSFFIPAERNTRHDDCKIFMMRDKEPTDFARVLQAVFFIDPARQNNPDSQLGWYLDEQVVTASEWPQNYVEDIFDWVLDNTTTVMPYHKRTRPAFIRKLLTDQHLTIVQHCLEILQVGHDVIPGERALLVQL
ncbi:hypothetical protein CC2G_013631 [Coprinopsis cinerea AmutBmut pab1-1]|nr:hypothetical protein CC2G_013631 [Coprinopsis cinerea AmutBmut pab1-1]KAG2008173.1 hypothetical protein CC2G_013631 [Coprinopsis cinerea AmutBmut pab1-1]